MKFTAALTAIGFWGILTLSGATSAVQKSKNGIVELSSHSNTDLETAREFVDWSNVNVANRILQEEDGDHTDEDGNHTDEDGDHTDEDGDHTDEDPDHDHELNDDKPWGTAIGAALVVNAATFVGVLVLVPILLARRWFSEKNAPSDAATQEKSQQRRRLFLHNVIPSLALGALLATAAFLIIPESILLLSGSHSDGEHDEDHDEDHLRRFLDEEVGEHDDHAGESEAAWKFGTAFLGGFILPLILSSFFPHAPEHEPVACPVCDANEGDSVSNTPMEVQTAVVGHSEDTHTETPSCPEEGCAVCDNSDEEEELAVDDFIPPIKEKNTTEIVVDTPEISEAAHVEITAKPKSLLGVEEGTPVNYRLCASILLGDFFHNFADGIFIGNAFLLCSNSIAWGIVAATIYHELAQELADFFLLTTQGHLPVWKALVLNFVSGLSILLGVVIILAADVSVSATGAILAVSAGVYVYLAASECLPTIDKEVKDLKSRAISVLCFVLGAVPIGLVLLNHGHCEEEH